MWFNSAHTHCTHTHRCGPSFVMHVLLVRLGACALQPRIQNKTNKKTPPFAQGRQIARAQNLVAEINSANLTPPHAHSVTPHSRVGRSTIARAVRSRFTQVGSLRSQYRLDCEWNYSSICVNTHLTQHSTYLARDTPDFSFAGIKT